MRSGATSRFLSLPFITINHRLTPLFYEPFHCWDFPAGVSLLDGGAAGLTSASEWQLATPRPRRVYSSPAPHRLQCCTTSSFLFLLLRDRDT